MPNIKSAAKRMRQSAKNQTRNRAVKAEAHTIRLKYLEAISAGDKTKSDKLYCLYSSTLDKAVKQGILKANNASRHKSRAAAMLAKLKPAAL